LGEYVGARNKGGVPGVVRKADSKDLIVKCDQAMPRMIQKLEYFRTGSMALPPKETAKSMHKAQLGKFCCILRY
jgi:hypothetical protein